MPGVVGVPEGVRVEVVSGSDVGKSFDIVGKTITIGRDASCDFVLDEKTVSKKHCQIVYRGGHFTVIDLGSLNKTKVNGRVYSQKNVANGDQIKIGADVLAFVWPGGDSTAQPAAEDGSANILAAEAVAAGANDGDDAVPEEGSA